MSSPTASHPDAAVTAGARPDAGGPARTPRRTPRRAPRRMRWLAVVGAAGLLLAAFIAWDRTQRPDPALVGRWTKGMHNQSGTWEATFTIGPDGHYRVETTVHDRGRLIATGGQFRMTSITRTSAVGSYRLLDPASLEVTTPAGKVTWKRSAGPLSDRPSQPMLGVWEAWPVIGGITWHQTITSAGDSSYTLASVTGDSGRLRASHGRWQMVSRRGRESEGTYQLTDPQDLVFTAPEGRSQWHRDTARDMEAGGQAERP